MAKKKINLSTVRQSESENISSLMSLFIKANNLEKGFEKISIEEKWLELMGQGVQSYTEKITLKGGTLLVKISSPSLRMELDYGKEKILSMMNDALGKEMIKKVILC